MQDRKISNSTRISAGIIGIMMLVIMLFSAFYIASEAGHHCTGEDCPVCTCIQICKNTLHQVCPINPAPSYIILFTGILMLLTVLFEVIRPHESLISQKIRINS